MVQIHKPLQDPTPLLQIDGIDYSNMVTEEVNADLDKLYFFPKLFYYFKDETTGASFPVLIFARIGTGVRSEIIEDGFLINKELDECIQLVIISFRDKTARTQSKPSHNL